MNTVEVENVVSPGSIRRVDADKYGAMKRAYLSVVPKAAPGATTAQMLERVIDKLPQDLFPDGAKAGWWAKCVQLDLEAKGIVKRIKPRSGMARVICVCASWTATRAICKSALSKPDHDGFQPPCCCARSRSVATRAASASSRPGWPL